MRELIPPGGAHKQRSAEKIAEAAAGGFDHPVTQVGQRGETLADGHAYAQDEAIMVRSSFETISFRILDVRKRT